MIGEGHEADRIARALGSLFASYVSVHAIAFDERLTSADVSLPATLAASVPKRRAEFIAGRVCARAALSAAGCTSREPIAIDAMRAPVWPAGFAGSITHAAGFAAAVAARTRDVTSLGIDVEKIVSNAEAESLAPQVMTPRELAIVSPYARDRAIAFTAIFAAKEALFKCIAPLVGRYFDFLDAEIVEAEAAKLTMRLCVDLSDAFRAGKTFGIGFVGVENLVVAGVSIRAPGVAETDPQR